MSPINAFIEAANGDKLANVGTVASIAGGAVLSSVEVVGAATETINPTLSTLGLGPLIVVSMLTGWRIFCGRQSESDKLRHEREQAAEQHRHAEEMMRLEQAEKVATTALINAAVNAHVHGIPIDPETGRPLPKPAPEPFEDPGRRD